MVILLIKSAEVADADFSANYDLLKIFIANSIEPDVGIPMLSDFRVSCLLLFFSLQDMDRVIARIILGGTGALVVCAPFTSGSPETRWQAGSQGLPK